MAYEEVDSGFHSIVFDEENKERSPWKICSNTFPRSFIVFVTQVTISLFFMTFSCLMIALKRENEDVSLWFAALGVAVGSFLPQPKL